MKKLIILIIIILGYVRISQADRTIMEDTPTTNNAFKLETAPGRVDIATTSYNGGVSNVGLYTTSNIVVSSNSSDNVVVFSSGSANFKGTLTATNQVLSTPLPVASGGTGASTASGARSDLSAAQSVLNADISTMTALLAIQSGLTVSSPTSLTATGASQYSLTTSSGISVLAGAVNAPASTGTFALLSQKNQLSCANGLTTDANGNINGCVPVSPQLGIWRPQGTVLSASLPTDNDNLSDVNLIPPEGGSLLLPNSTVFKMWFTTGWGSGNAIGVGYAESADGLTWVRSSTAPAIGEGRPSVFHVGTTYYMYTENFNASPNNIDVSTSADGEHFKLWHSNVISTATIGSLASQGLFNTGGTVYNGTLYLFFNEMNGSSVFNVGLATSTDYFNFTIFSTNPVLSPSPGGTIGAITNPTLVGNSWYAWTWAQLTSGQVPTDLYRYSAPAVTGPWTNSESGIDLPRYAADEGPNYINGQLGNPYVFQYSSTTYLYYSATSNGAAQTGNSHIKLAVAPLSLTSVVASAGGMNSVSIAAGQPSQRNYEIEIASLTFSGLTSVSFSNLVSTAVYRVRGRIVIGATPAAIELQANGITSGYNTLDNDVYTNSAAAVLGVKTGRCATIVGGNNSNLPAPNSAASFDADQITGYGNSFMVFGTSISSGTYGWLTTFGTQTSLAGAALSSIKIYGENTTCDQSAGTAEDFSGTLDLYQEPLTP